jgi:tetratricopeptide (TPR) repeat protein
MGWGGGWGPGLGMGWGLGMGLGMGLGGWGFPFFGNWLGNGMWGGFGLGGLGMGGLGLGGMGWGMPWGGVGAWDLFPTWGMNNFDSWGLGTVANDWLFSGYTNPYYNTVGGAQAPQTTIVYDYSQPINVAAQAPAPAAASSSEQVFSAARDDFKANNFQRALELTDQAIKDAPNVPVMHEFRALCLFALKRYDEAAAANYAVLSAGPGMNWTTLVGLYSDVDTYTNQLRALEAAVRSNPNAPSTEFLLGYHYMVQGHDQNAAARFETVTKVEPSDQLSASFAKALKKMAKQPTAVNVAGTGQPAGASSTTIAPAQPTSPGAAQSAAVADAEQPQEPELPPPPPANLVGTWKAQPSADLSIALTLQADGQFAWKVDSNGEKQTLTGRAGFKDNTLALLQEEGPPLVGRIALAGDSKFTFSPPTSAKAKNPGLTFTKS